MNACGERCGGGYGPRAGAQREVLILKEYQAVLLYVYPKLERLEENIGQLVEAKARASYAGKESTEACAKKMIEYLYVKDCFAWVRASLNEVLASLTKEERYLLEYKYFRRKKMLEGEFAGMCCPFAERTYYRRQRKLADKLNGELIRRGMDEAWFMRTFGEVPYMMAALRSVRAYGSRDMADKRACGSPQVRRAQKKSGGA